MTLKDMCEQAAKEVCRDWCIDCSGTDTCKTCNGKSYGPRNEWPIAEAIDRVAKAFAEKALWQLHGGEAAVMSRSNGSAIYVMEHVKRIADAIAAAEKVTG